MSSVRFLNTFILNSSNHINRKRSISINIITIVTATIIKSQ
jgi:hypothetical protein